MTEEAHVEDVEKEIEKEVEKETAPVRRGPLSALPRFEQELERFFGEQRPWRFDWPFSRADWPFLRSEMNVHTGSADVIDREEEVVVRVELPGFKKEDIDVSLNDASLTIKATSESESKDEDGDYYRREISSGHVSRTIGLPAEVVGDKAKARLKDGVLEITVPKAAKSKRQAVAIES